MAHFSSIIQTKVTLLMELQILFQAHPIGDKKFDDIPQISAVFLSCKRVELLSRTISAFILYMKRVEPDITYEIIVWDNNSGLEATKQMLKSLPIDLLVLSSMNAGIATALNNMFFSLARAPYILSLEEDWEATPGWSVRMPVMKMGMEILETESDVLEIWIREIEYDLPDHRMNRTDWLLTPPNKNFSMVDNGQIQYRKMYTGIAWGSYTNGASLKHKARLDSVGRFNGVNGEYTFGLKVKATGMGSAHICTTIDPDIKLHNRCNSESRPAQPFLHIGTAGRSPGHKLFLDQLGGEGEVGNDVWG